MTKVNTIDSTGVLLKSQRTLSDVLIDAARLAHDTAETIKFSDSVNGKWPNPGDEEEYLRHRLLSHELIVYYLQHYKPDPDAEFITTFCADCEEEYRSSEDSEICPICHGLNIENV